MNVARRLATLEAEEHRRAMALPPGEWLRRGWLDSLLTRLPAPERAELRAIIETALTDAGALDYRRITPAQRERATALLERIAGQIGAQLP